MARRFYMSLPGVGDWQVAMKESGAQLAPYQAYLTTAINAANNRALSLAWRLPTPDELRELEGRVRDRIDSAQRRMASAKHRRDMRSPTGAASGTWIILDPRPGQSEEPHATFDSFLKTESVFERPAALQGRLLNWSKAAEIVVRASDPEALALLLARVPTEIPPAKPDRVPKVPISSVVGPLLFLRPNTWPLKCQQETLEAIEGHPPPRLAPILRLAATRPTWSPAQAPVVEEDAWAFLKRQSDGALRDGTEEQREFVRRALGTPDFAVLEGPPGSGKTTAICELVVQLVRANKRVMLVASTHVAVDNVLERLIDWQDTSKEKVVLPIGIGDEADVTSDAVGAWVLKNLLRTWSGEVLDHLDDPGEVEPEGDRARRLLQEALGRAGAASALANLLLDASNLVCGTTIGILQHPAIKNARSGGEMEPFDVLILDEASKTTFTEFLVPAAYARRWVVVGDRRQLSPYIDDQDLAENLQGLLPAPVAQATAHAFLASSAVSQAQQVRSLVAVESDDEAKFLAQEAKARNVAAVDLDSVTPTALRGVQGVCLELLSADLVFGRPATIARWEHRLPGDLRAVTSAVPPLPDWNAHRQALGTEDPDEPVSWAAEVAWRLVRAYELRDNPGEAKRLDSQVQALQPSTLGESFFQMRRPRKLRDGRTQTPVEALAEGLENVRRVAMPSILEILERGAGSRGWGRDSQTALTAGLPEAVLRERKVSLKFQHRMHPEISAFPREKFYSEAGLLKDASGMEVERQWGYRRYRRRAGWIDIAPRARRRRGPPGGGGNTNPEEADAVMNEVRDFVAWAAHEPHPGRDPRAPWQVAVLTFYRAQEKELRFRLQKMSKQHGNTRNFQLPDRTGRVHVTLCTVGRFQGHEADLVLLSFVKSGSVGFLNSPNRLNVALTRARYQLVLVGHRSWLASSACRSDLLRSLGESSLYGHDFAWGRP